MTPTVEADSPFTDSQYIARMLRGTDLWLSPRTVEEFRPEDYPDVERSTRDQLASAVAQFRNVASTVDAQAPAQHAQRDAAWPAFAQIVRIVQNLVRDEWIEAANSLLSEAGVWINEEGWPSKKYPKSITEDFIGTYTLDRLVYAAEGVQLALIPVGRFAPGTEGVFDLAVLPAYDSIPVTRHGHQWVIRSLPRQERIASWSKELFVEKSLELARLP